MAIQQFQEFLLAGMVPALRDALGALRPGAASADALFPFFAQFVLDHYMEDIRAYRSGCEVEYFLWVVALRSSCGL